MRKTCLVGGMLMSSVITFSVFAPNVYIALACFAVAYGSLALTAASIWSLPGDVAPTLAHVAPSHAHLARSLEWIARVKPKRTILTNMHVDMDYDTLRRELPPGVEPAYDGMVITV